LFSNATAIEERKLTVIGPPLPKSTEQAILDALKQVGYSQSLVSRNVEFNLTGKRSIYLDPASLVAFWRQPFDQLSSAIAVRWLPSGDSAKLHAKALGKFLWTPFSVIARSDRCELWETLPTNGASEPTQLENVTYDALASIFQRRKGALGPDPVGARKLRYRQMALYEISESPGAFWEWAFRPTRDQLKRLLTHVLKESIDGDLTPEIKEFRLRWLLRFVGVRIAWDKEWIQTVSGTSRVSVKELVKAAAGYPRPLGPSGEVNALAAKFIDVIESFGPVNLSIADGGLLSHVLQTHGLLEDLKKEWKLYPTPPDLAWRMLQTIPIEAIPEEKRLIWDGTCGTGTLLVVGMERLRELSQKESKPISRLEAILLGNDKQPLLGDLTLIALDTALGDLQKPRWLVSNRNILDFEASSFPRRPTIIVGNPPFQATGPRPDVAIHVLNKYIDILEPGGLLSIVLPRSLLGATGGQAVQVRERLLREFEIYELWELPQGFATGVSSEAAIISGRKRYKYETQRSAVVWRFFEPSRRNPPLTDVVSSPDIWLSLTNKALESPLMLRLRDRFEGFGQLSNMVGYDKFTEGITAGTAGQEDVLLVEEAGCPPYLAGHTGMAPFHIPWRENRRWIRYASTRLWRPRRGSEALFRERKVLITRWSTGGSPWPVQAAVDENRLYPNDDFIAIAPEPSFSCELIAGIFNSALICCWLRLVNPSRTISVRQCRAVPIPTVWSEQDRRRLESIAGELANLRREITDRQSNAEAMVHEVQRRTLALDEVVYDAYEVPEKLRAEIGAYLSMHGKPRPGFDRPLVAKRQIKLPEATEVFGEEDGQELKALLESNKLGKLTEQESLRMVELVNKWEQAQVASSEAALQKERAGRGGLSRRLKEKEVL
jgi:hypothetical protein